MVHYRVADDKVCNSDVEPTWCHCLMFVKICGLKKGLLFHRLPVLLLWARVFCHSFRALTDCMFGQFSREQETKGSLDFSRRDRLSLVVVSKSRSFPSDSFEDVVHEGVHDAHRSARDTNVGVNLFQNSVDEPTIAFPPRSLSFDNLCSSFTFSTFLRTFLRRALPGALHWWRLTTGTHLAFIPLSQLRSALHAWTIGNDASGRCTSIYVLGLDRKTKTFDGSRSRPDSNVFWRVE